MLVVVCKGLYKKISNIRGQIRQTLIISVFKLPSKEPFQKKNTELRSTKLSKMNQNIPKTFP